MSKFSLESVSISGAPTIVFHFDGESATAALEGTIMYAVTSVNGSEVKLTDSEGVLADITVRNHSGTAAECLMEIASALMWSNWRWRRAKECEAERGDPGHR